MDLKNKLILFNNNFSVTTIFGIYKRFQFLFFLIIIIIQRAFVSTEIKLLLSNIKKKKKTIIIIFSYLNNTLQDKTT